ncbi:chaplin family protein [Streptomyces sp. NPDC048441]|uniref:chaplin family protein n=1 Tax=Streptomyces sp. NPDC048441 TaxID=3365552 RepID=UPI003724B53D
MRQAIGKGMLAAAAASSILSLSGSNAFAADAEAMATDSPGILSGNSVQAPLDVPVNACGNTANTVAAANPTFGNSCANSGDSSEEHTKAPQQEAEQRSAEQQPAEQQPAEQRSAPKHRAGKHRAPEQRAVRTDDGGSGYGDSGGSPATDTHSGSQSRAEGDASHSPGVLAGNNLQAPVQAPLNLCGNTVDVIAALNPAFGNSCANGEPAPTPPVHETPPQHETPPKAVAPPVERAVPRPVEPAQPPRHVASSTVRAKPHIPAQLAATGSEQDLLAAAAASAALLIGGGILYRRGRASSGRW